MMLRELCLKAQTLRDRRAIAAHTKLRSDIRCAAAAAIDYDKALKAYAYRLNVDRGTAMLMQVEAERATAEVGECCGS